MIILRTASRAVDRLLWRLAYKRSEHDGIPLRRHQSVTESAEQRVIAAIDLIAEADRRTYSNLVRYLPGGISIHKHAQTGAWFDMGKSACFLSADHVLSAETADIALSIVHEACHARLDHWGIRYDEPQRFRIEQICLRREVAFARCLCRLGDQKYDYLAWTKRNLESLDPEFLTEAAFAKRRRLELLRLLRAHRNSYPRWLRITLVLMARWRFRRDQKKHGPN